MMINWKKAIGLTAAVAMLVPMAACGSSSDSSSSSSSATSTGTQDVTLTVWSPQEDSDWMADMQKAFAEAHPEYKITWKNSVVSEGDAAKTVQTDPSSAADVYMFANDQLGTLVKLNAIAPVSDDVAKQVKDQNTETIVQSVTGTDGKIYGVPYTGNTYFMYYNKDKFSESDVKNLNTMLEKGKVAYPLSNSWYIPAFYLGAGMTMFGKDGTDASANIQFGDNADAVTKYLVDMVANSNFTNDQDNSGNGAFTSGAVDAYFSGSWDSAGLKEKMGDKLGAAEMPAFTVDGKDYTMKALAGSKAVAFNPNSKAPEAASKFAAYLGSTEAQKKHWEMRQIIPSDKTLTDLKGMSSDPAVKAQSETLANTSVVQPTIAAMNAWWTPAETFGNALVSKDINDSNYKQKTSDWIAQVQKDVKDQSDGE
ncbi:MAG: extracellular solute-binding protein [Bifidobacterium sp.]|nr:extracellular solute-binding protein [Bifidobacterium sp.]